MRKSSIDSTEVTLENKKYLIQLYDELPCLDIAEYANEFNIIHVDFNINAPNLIYITNPDIVYVNCNNINNRSKALNFCRLWNVIHVILDNKSYTRETLYSMLHDLNPINI